MKQLWMVTVVLLFAASYCAAQDEVTSSPAMSETVQPMPAGNYGGQAYGDGVIVENNSGGSSCGCGGGGEITGFANVGCDCCCAPATYYYSGCCCGPCGGGRMFGGQGFRPMFGGGFGRSRCCGCY